MKKGRTSLLPMRGAGLLLSLVVIALIALPAAAEELADNHHINIGIANPDARADDYDNDTYYYKFDGGGLNELHVTDSPSSPYGQVTNTTNMTGTFYITNTGGRGYTDDIVLMLAVNGTPDEEFELSLSSSGYVWNITTGMPTENNVSFATPVGETFLSGDFLPNITQIWKPYTNADYPIFYGQDMGDASDMFHLMFIDLKVGVLGTNCTYKNNLTYQGAARVDYVITGLPSWAAFAAYGYTFQSNQTKGISWTNKVSGTNVSGWTVMPD